MTTITLDKQHWLNTSHFLKIHEGKLIFWDYKSHCQFELSVPHLLRLIDFSTGSTVRDTILDREINQAGVLTDHSANSAWKWDWLAHIFHYGTCHPLPPAIGLTDQIAFDYTKSYTDFCESISDREPEVELIKGGLQINLPKPDLESFHSLSLWEVLAKRRTCRDFDGSAISLTDVSDLLFVAFGDQRAPDPTIPPNVKTYGFRRTSPSAGGLQCTEPYLWAINVEGLPTGIYHYLSRQHKLEIVTEGPPPHPIGTYLCNQQWANDLAFAIFMTCRMEKMWWKYPHSRAYRPMLMDVGHLSQTLNLCITSKHLHPWMTGYFHDSEIAELLQCTPELEHPILMVGAGHGSGSSLSRESRELFTSSFVER
ncbi:SagB/ThcOx family dehydrogenase [Variovorax ureilyticus]|uniref:SagB/ThcOx family dehydrogenase n=1 Tax=Variovorax ureilyticus TaxID=1836198 RepID=A0ABU8VES5_9BURK